MTIEQEDRLYTFLEERIEPFHVADVVEAIYKTDSTGAYRLDEEVHTFLEKRRLAFPLANRYYQTRRGYFEHARFVIRPTRLEIQNGILIPGHRCLPFENPILFPHEFQFLWKGEVVPKTTTEGSPEDFYSFYNLYGEEYAPQYIARDNPDNEVSFNAHPYEEPGEVSITTLDLRSFYRETAFVPGYGFIVEVTDWKAGVFTLQEVLREGEVSEPSREWARLLEQGFFTSFEMIGPAASTEEQLAFAFWFGGRRLLDLPAMSVETFMYEYTERIDTVPYGMETRFWYAGKEIPDMSHWTEDGAPPDKTELEEILYTYGLPVSEYVVQSYVRDALYQQDNDLAAILGRIVPAPIKMNGEDELILAQYVMEVYEAFSRTYSIFLDKDMGPVRHSAAELHTAVVALMSQLSSHGVDQFWLPQHTLVILSQLQVHCARILEDLDHDDPHEASDLETIDIALEGMIETYEDIKHRVQEALDGYRRSRLSVVRSESPDALQPQWRALQLVISGTSIWRRMLVYEASTLHELHQIIMAVLGWSGQKLHGFIINGELYDAEGNSSDRDERLLTLGEIVKKGITEFTYNYDYTAEWEIRISILHALEAGEAPQQVCCVAGEGAAPPEHIGGALRFRRFLAALDKENTAEQAEARQELGESFNPQLCDLSTCNNRLLSLSLTGS
ncbi:plasmid pRiA4b ORF-3 family protein [Gracilinema caldarium]|uniref:Plasmid pRiA4b ORF-3 family protein n=1 Tax=Gracilinema caldarium (strain ATCC 51460 / DSM 7334 / H1) TaxID=744872 RepID=F8EYI2_GRAC1|nr:plasmid pRiA4b ORF-3 family protein [Gracilinema caldarium]AEJ18414.1 plasmid pRiA4b ORF-3 family protein [Gracilinema caldarium DSM 7334]